MLTLISSSLIFASIDRCKELLKLSHEYEDKSKGFNYTVSRLDLYQSNQAILYYLKYMQCRADSAKVPHQPCQN